MSEKRETRTLRHVPGPADLAPAWGNDLPVVATPVLIWLTERCAMDLLEGRLGPREMSVGYAHQCRHLRPALEAPELEIEARLETYAPPFATFQVQVTQGGRLILEGRHTRALVEGPRFLAGLTALRTLPGEA